MAWTDEHIDFALSEHATPSVSTSVGIEPVWTLYDGAHDESDSVYDADKLVKPAVPTDSATVTSTNPAISCTFTSGHSTLLANSAMSTNSTVLPSHTFCPVNMRLLLRPHQKVLSTTKPPELTGLI